MVDVAVINQSDLEDASVQLMIGAVQEQLKEVAPVWNFKMDLHQIAKGDAAPTSLSWMVLLPDADQANALGYHDLTSAGLPMGKVFVNTTLTYGQAVSRVLSHEAFEMGVDPLINRTVYIGTRNYIVEVGDPFSLDSQGTYINGVLVSNIAFPDYYGLGNTGRMDWLGQMPERLPYMVNGTYLMYEEGNVWQHVQQFALADPTHKSVAKMLTKLTPGSRRERRMRRHQWKHSTVSGV